MHRRLRTICMLGLCGLLVLLALGCGGNVDNRKLREGHGGIKGTLFFEDGSPAAGALVQVINLPSLRAVADDNGTFEILNIPAGRRELVLYHKKPFAARSPVWVVRGHTITLDSSLSRLLPAVTLKGTISAAPRFHAAGISVVLKGAPYSTTTHNEKGEFVLRNIPRGCHILQISAPYFQRRETTDVCVNDSGTMTLHDAIVLHPSVSCGRDATCDAGALCHEGYCVEDPGGLGDVGSTSSIDMDSVKLGQSTSKSLMLLRNKGPGRLVVQRVSLEPANGLFSLSGLPAFPVTLLSGETLNAKVSFTGKELGQHRARLVMETNGQEHAHFELQLHAEVVPHPSNCLTPSPSAIAFSSLQVDQPHLFEVTISNRCGQTLLLQDRNKRTPSSPDEPCPHNWMASFSLQSCLNLLQTLPVKVSPGQSVTLQFQLIVKEHGALRGSLDIPHDETTAGSLSLPVTSDVQPADLSVSPQVLDYGLVPPEQDRILWVHFQSKIPLSDAQLKQLSFQLDEALASSLTPLSSRIARKADDARVIVVPVRLRMLSGVSSLTGNMRVVGLDALKQRPFVIRVKATQATATTPSVPAMLHLGAVNRCQSPKQPLVLSNPSSSSVFVNRVVWQARYGTDFSLEPATFPLEILPGDQKTVAWVKLTPGTQKLRGFAQLQVHFQQGSDIQEQTLTTAVQGTSGIPWYDTFTQPGSKKVDLYVYIDQSVKDLAPIHSAFASMLSFFQSEGVQFRLFPLDSRTTSVSPFTPNPASELKRLLQPTKEPQNRGLEVMKKRLAQRTSSQDTSVVVVLLSQRKDVSPFGIAHYLPASGMVFAGVPLSSCGVASKRYQSLTRETGGQVVDICQNHQASWTRWIEHMQSFIVGRRTSFVLRRDPILSTLQVSKALQPLSHGSWTYDQEAHSIKLVHANDAPPGSTVTVSYYNRCE